MNDLDIISWVVIPILTIGFYNSFWLQEKPETWGCHTHPNDRLLQHPATKEQRDLLFRCHTHPNDRLLQRKRKAPLYWDFESCHTHPNDRLLQPTKAEIDRFIIDSCHTHPNDRLLQRITRRYCTSTPLKVVIPILTIGFYNCKVRLVFMP